jgi:hypothetical protein
VVDKSVNYDINVGGNFEERLAALNVEIMNSKAAWADLGSTFKKMGAQFRKPASELEKLRETGNEALLSAEMMKPAFIGVATASRTMARALNRLNAEQNDLNTMMAAELVVLDQAVKGSDPRIIQLRGRARATARFTRELEKLVAAEEFERLNAEAGLPIQKKFASSMSTQAAAAERAAAAQRELAVSQMLAKQGMDARGKPLEVQGPRTPDDVERDLRAQVAREKAKKAQDARLKELRTEQGLLDDTSKKIKGVTAASDDLGRSGKKTDGIFSQFMFTFRRLVGVMALFTVARTVVRGFNQMISGAVRFNAAIETNRVGLAGLITAAGNVRDLQGGRLSLEEQLGRAQNIAIGQMKKLQAQALETAASYEEVSTAFTQAVAPGISAGLTLDEIRNVTVQISQAATGLGVAQNQLAEEIRSLFQGTINPRNTRIATALGITSQDIRRAKETGQLFEFISGRFAAISATGKRLMNTFTGQLSNAADAFSQLLATSSRPLFEQLKSGLLDIQKGIFSVVEDGVVFNPKALQAFDGLFKGLARGVLAIREAFSTINIQGFADSLGLVGETLGFVAGTLAKAFALFFDVAAPAVTLVKTLFALFTSAVRAARLLDTAMFGFLSTTVQTTAKLLLAGLLIKKLTAGVVTLWKTARSFYLAFRLAQGAMIVTTTVSTTLLKNMTRFLAVSRAAILPLLAVAGALTLISYLLPDDTKNTVFDGLAKGLNYVTSALDEVMDRMVTVKEEATTATAEGLGVVGDALRDLAGDIKELTSDLEVTLREIASETKISADVLGASPELASQATTFFRALAQGQEKAIEAQKKRAELEANLSSITRQGMIDGNAFTATQVRLLQLDERRLILEKAIASQQAVVAKARKEQELSRPFLEPGEWRTPDPKIKDATQVLNNLLGSQKKTLEEIAATEKTRDAFMQSMKVSIGEIEAAEWGITEAVRLQNAALTEMLSQELQRLSIVLRISRFETDNKMNERKADLELQVQTLNALVVGNERLLAAAVATHAVRKTGIEIVRLEAEHLQDLEVNQRMIAEAEKDKTAAGREGLALLLEQRQLLNESYQIELDFLKVEKAIREEEKRRAQLRLSGSFGQGFDQGLQDFKNANNSIYEVGQNFASGAMDQIGSFIGSSFRSSLAAAFDPTQNFELSTAVTNLGLDIAASLVTDLAKNALAGLIPAVAAPAETVAPVVAATEAATVQTNAAFTAGGIVTTSATIAGSKLFDGAFLAGTALITAASTAAKIMAGTSIAGAAGGAPKAKGGPIFGDARDFTNARGFARGGQAFPRRPRTNIDSRDTIPAWLRPGEWVIRPEAVRHYGHDLMAALNSRRINPALLRGLGSPKAAPVTKRSFATGGPVQAQPSPSQEAGVTLALQFHDEQTMDRALAVGSESTLRFARRHRSAYRAALGI